MKLLLAISALLTVAGWLWTIRAERRLRCLEKELGLEATTIRRRPRRAA